MSYQGDITEAFRDEGALDSSSSESSSTTDSEEDTQTEVTQAFRDEGALDSSSSESDGGDGGQPSSTSQSDSGGDTVTNADVDEAVGEANRNLAGRRDAAAENRARAPDDRDIDQAFAEANRNVAGQREAAAETRQFRNRELFGDPRTAVDVAAEAVAGDDRRGEEVVEDAAAGGARAGGRVGSAAGGALGSAADIVTTAAEDPGELVDVRSGPVQPGDEGFRISAGETTTDAGERAGESFGRTVGAGAGGAVGGAPQIADETLETTEAAITEAPDAADEAPQVVESAAQLGGRTVRGVGQASGIEFNQRRLQQRGGRNLDIPGLNRETEAALATAGATITDEGDTDEPLISAEEGRSAEALGSITGGAALAGGAAAAGVAAGRAVQGAPDVDRNVGIRARGGDIVPVEDLADPPTRTEGLELPGFTERAQADPEVARQEFLEQARQNELAGDEPTAITVRGGEDVREFGGFGRESEAPAGSSEIPGQFFSADVSNLRLPGTEGQGTSVGLPSPTVRRGRALAERDVDVDVAEGQTTGEVAEFIAEDADRSQSFVRGGDVTPEQETIAPPGARFADDGGVFGIRVGGRRIPGTDRRVGGQIVTGRLTRRVDGDTDADTGTAARGDSDTDPETDTLTDQEVSAETTRALRSVAEEPDTPFAPVRVPGDGTGESASASPSDRDRDATAGSSGAVTGSASAPGITEPGVSDPAVSDPGLEPPSVSAPGPAPTPGSPPTGQPPSGSPPADSPPSGSTPGDSPPSGSPPGDTPSTDVPPPNTARRGPRPDFDDDDDDEDDLPPLGLGFDREVEFTLEQQEVEFQQPGDGV